MTKSLGKAFDRIEEGKPVGSINGTLGAAANQASVFINQVDTQRGERINERAAGELVADGRALVATIEEAKKADQ